MGKACTCDVFKLNATKRLYVANKIYWLVRHTLALVSFKPKNIVCAKALERDFLQLVITK